MYKGEVHDHKVAKGGLYGTAKLTIDNKEVAEFDVFENYTEISNDVPEWKKQRELRGG